MGGRPDCENARMDAAVHTLQAGSPHSGGGGQSRVVLTCPWFQNCFIPPKLTFRARPQAVLISPVKAHASLLDLRQVQF